jgi:hypothetical protein
MTTKSALLGTSTLHAGIREGLGALEKTHKQLIDEKIRASFVDSLDIDEGLKKGNEQENRWDYLLGHGETSVVVGLEPHSAYTSEVSTVIAKKSSARKQLQGHLKPGSTIAAWFWVASGKVDFVPHEKVVRRLDQEGITFVGGMLRAKDLPKPSPKTKPRKGS